MQGKARGSLTQLAMGAERLSHHFIVRHYPPKSPRHRHSIGIILIVSLLSILALPSGDARDISASIAQARPTRHQVTVTAYTNIPECTDSTPSETASLLKIKPKHYGRLIALSPDLARKYKFGDRFYLQVDGRKHLVEFQDLMARRHKNRTDFLLASRSKCMKFGVTRGVLIPVEDKTRPGAVGLN